jgi:hypothetical protein
LVSALVVIALGELRSSPPIAFLGQFLLAAWSLASLVLRLVNPDGMIYWLRGFSPITMRMLAGKGSWPELTREERGWTDLFAGILAVVGFLILVLTLHQVLNGCEAFVIC